MGCSKKLFSMSDLTDYIIAHPGRPSRDASEPPEYLRQRSGRSKAQEASMCIYLHCQLEAHADCS